MRKLFLLICMFAVTGATFAQEENGPEITFEEETIDYGTLDKGADGKRMFVFTNTGNEPLIISNCKGSCGCTVPTCPKEPIMPGESGEIEVKYDTQRVGSFTKAVTVTSNAKTPTKVVQIKGVINNAPKEETTPKKDASNFVSPN